MSIIVVQVQRAEVRGKITFGELLYTSFKETYGPFITIIGFILVFVGFYIVPSSETIAIKHVFIIVVLLIYLNFIFISAAYSANKSGNVKLPSVKYAAEAPNAYQPSIALILLEASELFSYDAIVSIYMSENGIEQLVGIGKIINIQQNGNIQVLVINDLSYNNEWEKYRTNDITVLQKLLVKPNVPSFVMEAMNNG